MPEISVIIPVYNSEATIDKCLKSVTSQTIKSFEIIVINDGSTDLSGELLCKWGNEIKLYNQENKGAPSARNFGFKKSRGRYVIFCDADIVMEPTMLEEMHDALEDNEDIAYAYSSFEFGFKNFKLFSFDDDKLKKMPYIHTTSLIRRDAFPLFDETLKRFQDWDLFLTILDNGGMGIWIDKFLFKVKAGGTMSSWLPKFLYKIPFLKSVKDYKQAELIIKEKHNL